jgi:hypothetical protein
MARRYETQWRTRTAGDREEFVQREQRNQPRRRKPHKSFGLDGVHTASCDEFWNTSARDCGVYEHYSDDNDRKVTEYQIHDE